MYTTPHNVFHNESSVAVHPTAHQPVIQNANTEPIVKLFHASPSIEIYML